MTSKQQARLQNHKRHFPLFVEKVEGGALLTMLFHPHYSILYWRHFREYPDPTGAKEKLLESQVQTLQEQIGALLGKPGSGYASVGSFEKQLMPVLHSLAATHSHHDGAKLVHLADGNGLVLDYFRERNVLLQVDQDAFFPLFGEVVKKALSNCRDKVEISLRAGGDDAKFLGVEVSYEKAADADWGGLQKEADGKGIMMSAWNHGEFAPDKVFNVAINILAVYPGQLPKSK